MSIWRSSQHSTVHSTAIAPRGRPGCPNSKDPSTVLGKDEMLSVLGHLSATELARVALVCSTWRILASEETLWERHCKQLWRDKVFVPLASSSQSTCNTKPSSTNARMAINPGSTAPSTVAPVQEQPWKAMYDATLRDGRRIKIEQRELCAFDWNFRFKREAGEFWMSLDPYWTRETPLLVRNFHPDGSLTAPPDDPLWGGHENRWRFTKSRDGVKGQFVKVNHWPSLSISRTPDWGWRMENPWVVYTAQLEAGGEFRWGVPAVGEGSQPPPGQPAPLFPGAQG